jgi:predicted amidophosphoribosyltransferase
LRTAILALKRGRRDVARRLGEILAERIEGTISSDAILVGVPTARTRRRERGFDQGPILASIAARRLEMASVTALRARSDWSQHTGSREERLSVVGRFAGVYCRELGGREVILVDDVATTGATLIDSANALRAHGARVSLALVIAYTPRRSRSDGSVDSPLPRG